MMTDRFDAQLRQHLVGTANERPADGQLVTLMDRIDATAQRHPLAARLSWNPGRIGPFPSAVVRFGLVAAALALAVVAGALLAGSVRPPTTVFEGSWITVDPGDGSGMSLVVGPGNRPAIYFEDGYASGGSCINDVVKRFTALGTGEVAGDRLRVEFPDGGGCGLRTVEMGAGFYTYESSTDTLVDGLAQTWSRALGGDRPAPGEPGSQAPATKEPAPAPPSPPSAQSTFTSAMHGISMAYPAGWKIRPATEPWTGADLAFDTPGADVISDPNLGDGLYLAIASLPYRYTQDAWRDEVLEWLCPQGTPFVNWTVDGAESYGVECESNTAAVFVFVEDREWLIRLVAAGDDPGLAETYDWEWLASLLETADLRPEDAVDAPADPAEDICIQFDAPGRYSAPIGPLSLTVAMPGTSAEPWIGERGDFNVLRAACGEESSSGWIDTGIVTEVDKDACAGAPTPVDGLDDASAAVAAADGIEVLEQVDVEVGGYAAVRFDIRARDDANPCPDGQLLLIDGLGPLYPGVSLRLYIVDVDGTTLALGLFGHADWDPPVRNAVDRILDSMEIALADGG